MPTLVFRLPLHGGVKERKQQPMETYIVLVYQATVWSFLTQADHYSEYRFVSAESYPDFRKRLRTDGFQHPTDQNRWIMPGAILEVYNEKEQQE